MAKVALITYHRAHNNGSFLQAFATQQAIENLGHQCDVIDFSTPKQQYVYDVYKKIRTPKDVLKNCYAFLNRKIIQKRHDDFDTLINNNLNLTKHFYQDVLEMGDLESQYDIFLSGSDQIWNMDAWDYDDAYCLSFVKNKPKVSYASSLGGHILDRLDNTALADKYRNLLSSYKEIGVREQSAKQYLDLVLDREVTQVLDPTLLLTEHEYERISAPRLVDEPYIFYYAIDNIELNESAARAVQEFSKKTMLPVYVIFTGNKSLELTKFGFNVLKVAAPNHYLSMIKHAEYVLSASFHGTAFSINFQKQFYVVRGKKNGKLNLDDRMTSLLRLGGLENRQLSEGNSWDDNVIDYGTVNTKISKEVERSKRFLKRELAYAGK